VVVIETVVGVTVHAQCLQNRGKVADLTRTECQNKNAAPPHVK